MKELKFTWLKVTAGCLLVPTLLALGLASMASRAIHPPDNTMVLVSELAGVYHAPPALLNKPGRVWIRDPDTNVTIDTATGNWIDAPARHPSTFTKMTLAQAKRQGHTPHPEETGYFSQPITGAQWFAYKAGLRKLPWKSDGEWRDMPE